jgi:rod shape-determining protein MreC
MRSLLSFLLRYNPLIIFLLLEGLSFYYLTTRNSYHNTRAMFVFRGMTQGIESRITEVRSFIHMKDVNKSLSEENVELRNQIERLRKTDSVHFTLVTDSLYGQQYLNTMSEVIDNSIHRQKNFFSINKGRKHGLSNDMAVISPEGVAGVIVGCSENFSVAMSVLNLDFKLSSRLKPTGYFGSLNWDGKDYRYAMLSEIPQHVELSVGDTIETTGFSALFPEGVTVGIVSSYEKPGGDFYNIRVRLSTDFRKLQYVNVIGNIRKKELLELQNTFQ